MNEVMIPVSRLVVGTREDVITALRTAHTAGRLVWVGRELRPVPGDAHGRVYGRVGLLEARPAAPTRRSASWPPPRTVAIGAAVAVVVAVVGLLVWAVLTLVAWIAGHTAMVVGVAVFVGLVLGVAGPGVARHCPGCRR